MPAPQVEAKIRRARQADAPRIATLCGQLGYPTTATEMAVRLKSVLRQKNAVCFVAEKKEDGVIGWIHASVRPLLEVDRRADVDGLVVDDKVQGQGAGAGLLDAAEKWARKRGCVGMSVRSNVIRDSAHRFYLKQGYEHYKTQKAFRKTL